MIFQEVGILMKERREFLGLNQLDLAEIAGVSIKTIYAIELGKGNPSFETLVKLAKVLGLEIIVRTKQS